jgi:hypothetical protein
MMFQKRMGAFSIMSDLDDVMVAAGIVWIVSSLIKGLGYLIIGLVFFCYLIAAVCKGVYVFIRETRAYWPPGATG